MSMVRLTNQEIVDLYEVLSYLRQGDTQSLPIEIGYVLVKDMKMLEPSYLAVSELRDQILKTYGEDQGDGSVRIPDESIAAAQDDMNRLASVENTPELDLVPLAAIKSLSLPLDVIYKLYPIINGETS